MTFVAMEIDFLTQEEMDALSDYSCTIPTGTTIGKKWKRREPYRDDQGPPFYWYTGEYVPHPDPELMGIKWRRIQIISKRVVSREV